MLDFYIFIRYNEFNKSKEKQVKSKKGGTVQRKTNELPYNLRTGGTVQRKRNIRLR